MNILHMSGNTTSAQVIELEEGALAERVVELAVADRDDKDACTGVEEDSRSRLGSTRVP